MLKMPNLRLTHSETMSEPLNIRVIEGCLPGDIPSEVLQSEEPLLLKAMVSDWPVVEAFKESLDQGVSYLSRYWTQAPVTAYVGEAEIEGRFFYDEDFTGFNFKSGSAPLGTVFQKLAENSRAESPSSIYVGSTPVDQWLPGFRAENDVAVPDEGALVSFWLGNETRVSAHFDFPDNIACVVTGQRRFTLFPPDQVGNLYVGPVDRTPSGQSISLVDVNKPDFDRFPAFREALANSIVVDMAPGDALFVPSMWWHHVESLSPFNMMINYWWCDSPAVMGSPTLALLHAMLAVRDLPERQRQAWKTMFDHYIFNADESVYQHIPESGRGCLAPIDDATGRQLRAEIMNRLNQ